MNERTSTYSAHLVDAIKTIGATGGDSFKNDGFARLLETANLPSEAGFTFFNFSNGYVTFMVPRQNPADWYAKNGWIASGKEKIAKTIANKYGLFLNEPLDGSFRLYPEAAAATARHHLAFSNLHQPLIIVHPLFLKICLYEKSHESLPGRNALIPVSFGADILKDISPLYQKN